MFPLLAKLTVRNLAQDHEAMFVSNKTRNVNVKMLTEFHMVCKSTDDD